jgi:hypothetical protein
MIHKRAAAAMIRTNLSPTYCTPHQLRIREIGKLRSDRKGAVTNPTAARFTGLVTSIDLDAADGAAARPSGHRDGSSRSRRTPIIVERNSLC